MSPHNRADGMFITCVLPEGEGYQLLSKLAADKGVTTATLHHARGSGAASSRRKGFITHIKKDVITVAVEAAVADDIFEYLYCEAGIYRPHSGMIYMERLTGFKPPVPLPDDIKPEETE